MSGSSPTPEEIDRRFAEIVSGWEQRDSPGDDPSPFSFDAMFDEVEVDDDPYIPPPAEPVPLRTPLTVGFALIGIAVLVAFARLAGVAVPNPLGWVVGFGGVAGLVLLLAQAWRRKAPG
ncbi:MAG TPA: hypothetical protein VFN73_02605 [Propionibacteriaceae bacterium]|nr:hypothetical protein [Propionibacteriaceae bacterium]